MGLILAMVSASAPGNESHLRVISITCRGCRKETAAKQQSRKFLLFTMPSPQEKAANEGFRLGFLPCDSPAMTVSNSQFHRPKGKKNRAACLFIIAHLFGGI